MRISDWSSDVCSSDLQCVELGLLRPARQVAIQDQVADIQKIAVLRKLVDGIAAIQQLALVAIDIRNARFACRRRQETRLVREHPTLVVQFATIEDIRTDGPLVDRTLYGCRAVGERNRSFLV